MSERKKLGGQDFARASITAAVVADAMSLLTQAETHLEAVAVCSIEADRPLIAGMLDHVGSCIEHCADYQGDLSVATKAPSEG
jgi:hypothetical protein